MKEKNLKEWLDWIQLQHKKEMDLSLDRVLTVAKRLGLSHPSCPIITIAGTNGKGSCVAGLEAIYSTAGYKVGAFTSPILLRHNEYVRIEGCEVEDAAFCDVFTEIEAVRQSVPLTFFEFNTLAALLLFERANLDVWLLEVGLGGRLDAVNIMDADLAVISSIAIDHAEWLGSTRELIAREKAGIFRSDKPAVCGDFDPPQALMAQAKQLSTPLYCQGKEFNYQDNAEEWSWRSQGTHYEHIPKPMLALQNLSTVLMANELLQPVLPVTAKAIIKGITTATLPGRIQIFSGPIHFIYDVSHNPAAAEFLVKHLKKIISRGVVRAVFSMLSDKDIVNTIIPMKALVTEWYTASLPTKRGATLEKLKNSFVQAEVQSVQTFNSVTQAYLTAINQAVEGDYIVVFGSFYTVAEALSAKQV